MADPIRKFDAVYFAKLWESGHKDKAQEYRKSFQVAQCTTEEAKQPVEEKTQDDLAVLRAKYTEVTGKNVSIRYKNDAERLKANTKI